MLTAAAGAISHPELHDLPRYLNGRHTSLLSFLLKTKPFLIAVGGMIQAYAASLALIFRLLPTCLGYFGVLLLLACD